jgi:hypothetical protein
MSRTRQGTVLILVAGISALLASLALTFMVRNRSDAEETRVTLREVQARIMLVAALNYVQECSRIGWDRYPRLPPADPADITPDTSFPASPPLMTADNDAFPGGGASGSATVRVHEEAFGWIDVRDGSIGPRTAMPDSGPSAGDPTPHAYRAVFDSTPAQSDGVQQRPYWPAPGGIARCPMYAWRQPPFAIQPTACYNPIQADPAQSAASDYLWPYLRHPDPQPLGSKGENGTFSGAAAARAGYVAFAKGNAEPRVQTTGKAWFRVLRDGPTTFLITCGAGATLGFRSMKEATDQGLGALFNDDPSLFQSLQDQETRFWYRAEWSPSGPEGTYHWELHHATGSWDSYLQWPMNASHSWTYGPRSPSFDRHMGGTFRWIQRLVSEPTFW